MLTGAAAVQRASRPLPPPIYLKAEGESQRAVPAAAAAVLVLAAWALALGRGPTKAREGGSKRVHKVRRYIAWHNSCAGLIFTRKMYLKLTSKYGNSVTAVLISDFAGAVVRCCR